MFATLSKVLDMLTPAERRRGIALLGFMGIAALFELVGVGALYPFLTLVADPNGQANNVVLAWLQNTVGVDDPTHFVVLVGSLVLGLIILTNLATAATMWFQVRYVWNVNDALSQRLLARYLHQPYAWFLNQNTSRLAKNVVDDAHKVTSGTLDPTLTLASRTMASIAIIGLLLVIEPWITLATIAVLGGGYIAMYLGLRRVANIRGRKWANANTKRYHVVSEAFGGVKDVKVLGLESVMVERFGSPSRKYTHNYAVATIIKRLPTFVIQTLAFGGITAILLALILLGRNMATVIPVVGMFAFAGYRLLPMFQQILASLVTFRFSDHLVSLVHDDLVNLDAIRTVQPKPLDIIPLPVGRTLELRSLTYRYPGGDRPAVNDITLTIQANTSVALVGHTGAGKTTLADVILGLLEPQDGEILVDDITLDPALRPRWRRNIGYVPQSIYLSDDTIARNIAFGVPKDAIDDEAVRRAARIAQVHDFIVTQLPSGYETEVGERGVRLSGGQRQRIGIARALYHDPAVLVFDEATSDIDNVTEAHITQAMERLAGSKTMIIIAHRLSTIRECDAVFVLENGTVTGSGTYDELLTTHAGFRDLAQVVQAPINR